MTRPFHQLPEEVTIPQAELRAVMVLLEQLLELLEWLSDAEDQASDPDRAIGRMTRWMWPLLGELDEGGDYDE